MEGNEKTETEKKSRCHIRVRYVVAMLGFYGMFTVYSLRMNMSVAMVAMVNQTAIRIITGHPDHEHLECHELIPDNEFSEETHSYKGKQYIWNSVVQSRIMGSFFYGYVLSQLPGGMLSENYGAKWVFGSGIAISGVLTLLTEVAASWGEYALMAVRVLIGLALGVTFPAINFVVSLWSPENERSRFSTLIFTGSHIGNVVTMPVTGLLCSTHLLGGWPSVFYLFGSLALIWFLLWTFLMFETPEDHPRITEEEKIYILTHQKHKSVVGFLATPWKSIFTSVPMWALLFAHTGHNFGYLILLNHMPMYLSTILHFKIHANGFLSALPYLAQAITAQLVSVIADNLRQSKKLSITNIRKLCNSIGLFGPAVCVLLITISGCRPALIVSLLTLSLTLNAFIYSGFNVTHVDMAPDFAGTCFGITNSVSNTCGIFAPMLVGYFTTTGATIKNWNKVFYLSAAIYILCGIIFALFGSAEPQAWGIAKEDVLKAQHDQKRTKPGA